MIQLPRNATVAALALATGLLLGAGGYHFLFHEEEPQTDLGKLGEMEGQGVLERIREIAPRDTAGQEEADVEIRYRTKTDTVRDSVYVPIPSSLSEPKLSDATPIEVSSNRVTWTYWNPSERRYEQKLYAVPQDNFSLRAHALTRAYAPLRAPSLSVQRVWAGVGISLRYRRLEAAVSALTAPDLSRQRVSFGVRWRLW